jgi:inhibitor of KinA
MNAIQIGENSLALTVSLEKTPNSVRLIRRLYDLVRARNIPGIVSIRPGLDTLILQFQESQMADKLMSELQSLDLEKLIESSIDKTENQQQVMIPVCYEENYAIDLESVSKKTGLTGEEIARIHCSVIYEVWMLGFMPGFPYLGELPERLHIVRKGTPDPNIPAGSIAIAEEYSGIYPFDSPGGWHVIGRTPVSIIDYTKEKPWLLDYGARVQFFPISSTDFNQLKGKYEKTSN